MDNNNKGTRPNRPVPPPKPSKLNQGARKPIDEALKTVMNNESSKTDQAADIDDEEEFTPRDSAPSIPPPTIPSNDNSSRPKQPPPPPRSPKSPIVTNNSNDKNNNNEKKNHKTNDQINGKNTPMSPLDIPSDNSGIKDTKAPYRPIPVTSPKGPFVVPVATPVTSTTQQDTSTNPFNDEEEQQANKTNVNVAKPNMKLSRPLKPTPSAALTNPISNQNNNSNSNKYSDHHSTTKNIDLESTRSSDILITPSNTPSTTATTTVTMKGDAHNEIYHLNTFSQGWFLIFVVLHIVQFTLLLVTGWEQLTIGASILLVLLVIVVLGLTIYARSVIHKSKLGSFRNIQLRRGVCTPQDETDSVPDTAVLAIAMACLLEGIAFAVYVAVLAGHSSHLHTAGLYNQDTILQVLRFASITLLTLHRIIRPANRIDPMRTILEVSYYVHTIMP